jgi:ssRNA-specific RNase YbeY (16S rRNA maturation enzyme)
MLHLLGFYHEPSNEAAMELEEEEQLILKKYKVERKRSS